MLVGMLTLLKFQHCQIGNIHQALSVPRFLVLLDAFLYAGQPVPLGFTCCIQQSVAESADDESITLQALKARRPLTPFKVLQHLQWIRSRLQSSPHQQPVTQVIKYPNFHAELPW